MGVRSGREYLESLGKNRKNVFYHGEAIDVLKAPSFTRTADAIAQFYDFQNLADTREVMTYETEDGDRAGMAFLEARSKEDLHKKSAAYALWADVTCGYMGRSPDYMNACVSVLAMLAKALGRFKPEFGTRARNIYLDARRRDLNFTHTFAQLYKALPKVDQKSGELALPGGKIKETKDGVLINGTRALATLAPFSNSNYDIFNQAFSVNKPTFRFSYLAPVDLPGIRWMCRDSMSGAATTHFESPLASRIDEMDCIGVYEDCLIPWDCVVLYGDDALSSETVALSATGYQHHALIRNTAKLRFLLGLAHLVADYSSLTGFMNIQEKLGDILVHIRALEAIAYSAVENPVVFDGYYFANPDQLDAGTLLAAEFHTKAVNTLMTLGGARLVGTAQEETIDMLGGMAEEYFKGYSPSATDNVTAFRLARDICCSSWGARQTLYESVQLGDSTLRKCRAYLTFNKESFTGAVRRILKTPATKEEPFPRGDIGK